MAKLNQRNKNRRREHSDLRLSLVNERMIRDQRLYECFDKDCDWIGWLVPLSDANG